MAEETEVNEGRIQPVSRINKSDFEIIASKVTGTVKWFNVKSGYGFINRHDNEQDVFVHQTAIVNNNPCKLVRSVGDGETVQFDVIASEKGNEATNVTGPDGYHVIGSKYAADKRSYRRPYRRMNGAGDNGHRATGVVGEGTRYRGMSRRGGPPPPGASYYMPVSPDAMMTHHSQRGSHHPRGRYIRYFRRRRSTHQEGRDELAEAEEADVNGACSPVQEPRGPYRGRYGRRRPSGGYMQPQRREYAVYTERYEDRQGDDVAEEYGHEEVAYRGAVRRPRGRGYWSCVRGGRRGRGRGRYMGRGRQGGRREEGEYREEADEGGEESKSDCDSGKESESVNENRKQVN